MVTPNAPDFGPAMSLNEAFDNEEGVLKMPPIEQLNISPAVFSHSDGHVASRNEVGDI